MNTLSRCVRAVAALGLAAGLVACGGGSSDDPVAPSPSPSALELTAHGSSASTVSLAWPAVPGATGYTLERRTAGGEFAPLTELPADVRVHVDTGLAAETAYSYRLVARGAGSTIEAAASTTTDVPLTSAEGASLAELARGEVGPAGGRVASADGSVVLDVPADAFAANTLLVLRSQTNTAPGGHEDGVQLEAVSAPAKPLTLTLAYSEDSAANADGLGVAVQRDDGSWWALPLQARDRAARRMTLLLPLPLPSGTATGRARAEHRQSAAAGPYRLNVVRIQAMYLSPPGARVRTGATQRFVPFARVLARGVGQDCSDPAELCVPLPVLEPRELPFANDKPGYARQWLVQGIVGGGAAQGTVQPESAVGAVYTAPPRAPTPNPVTVTFRSTHQNTGRMVELNAAVTVAEPVWIGIVHGAMDGSADIGFTFSAQAVWTMASPPSEDVFHAVGTQSVHVINITCTASATPDTVALPPGLLKIDRSTEPVTYTLEVGSLWNTVISGSCPGHGGGSVPMVVPGLLQVSGTLSHNGTRIEGSASLNNIQWEWAFDAQ